MYADSRQTVKLTLTDEVQAIKDRVQALKGRVVYEANTMQNLRGLETINGILSAMLLRL